MLFASHEAASVEALRTRPNMDIMASSSHVSDSEGKLQRRAEQWFNNKRQF